MVIFIKVLGLEVICMDLENINIKMEDIMKVIGKWINLMEKVC